MTNPTPDLVTLAEKLRARYGHVFFVGDGPKQYDFSRHPLIREAIAVLVAPMVDMTPPATARDRWMYEQGRLAERDPRTPPAPAPVARARDILVSNLRRIAECTADGNSERYDADHIRQAANEIEALAKQVSETAAGAASERLQRVKHYAATWERSGISHAKVIAQACDEAAFALATPPAATQVPGEPCPTCGGPCTTEVLMRGGDHGWGTTDKERTVYRALRTPAAAPPASEMGMREALERLQRFDFECRRDGLDPLPPGVCQIIDAALAAQKGQP